MKMPSRRILVILLILCPLVSFATVAFSSHPYALWPVVPWLELKRVPAPPQVTNESMNLGGRGASWVLVYVTGTSLEEATAYYRNVLPKEGWTTDFIEETFSSCVRVTRNRQTYVVEIRQLASEQLARVFVNFPDTFDYCNELFAKR